MLLSKIQFSRRLLAWYDRNRRDLPWRAPLGHPANPYHVLVSELMLQQTQVATVISYFHAFIERWPDVSALAAADEQEVLKRWQGLGYYSRARNLLATARRIALEHDGKVPANLEQLHSLPGIGRYTAGAVASIGYDLSAPIVDGNVARVLSRIDRIETELRSPETQRRLWERAEQILPTKRIGDFNSAMMELGATVCTPRSPQCLICPVNKHCEAFAAGIQDQIPRPRKTKPTPLIERQTCCIQSIMNDESHWLIEQRPEKGRWAGMWQFVTLEADDPKRLKGRIQAATSFRTTRPEQVGTIEHSLTHRRYRFEVYTCQSLSSATPLTAGARRWVRLTDLEAYPLPRPHVRIVELLQNRSSRPASSPLPIP